MAGLTWSRWWRWLALGAVLGIAGMGTRDIIVVVLAVLLLIER